MLRFALPLLMLMFRLRHAFAHAYAATPPPFSLLIASHGYAAF